MHTPNHKVEWMARILLLWLGSIILFRTPYNASNMEIFPDSVEYAVGAQHLASMDGYHMQVGGRNLPPRYPPWFSMALAPAYWLFGSEIGNAIWVVFAFSMFGLLSAFEIGRKISGVWGGVSAGLLLLFATDYHYWGRQIMTDVPSSVLVLILLWVWLGMIESPQGMKWGLAGILLALATAFRPTSFAFVLPFLFLAARNRGRWSQNLSGLLTPLGILLGLSAYYNHRCFGSIFRSGYSFWCAVPYDYADLLYSLRYIPDNLYEVWGSNGVWLTGVFIVLWYAWRRWGGRSTPCIHIFAWLGGMPILFFYLVYFYPDARFYLPLAALMAVGCGALAGAFLKRLPASLLICGEAALIVAGIWMITSLRQPQPPIRRQIADSILRETPFDAVIVSGIDPVYLENFPEMGKRQIIPASRKVEYASKVVVRKKISKPQPKPVGWWDSRCPGLLTAGAEEAIPWTAMEHPGRLGNMVSAQQAIWMDRRSLSDDQINTIAQLAGLAVDFQGSKCFAKLVPQLAPAPISPMVVP